MVQSVFNKEFVYALGVTALIAGLYIFASHSSLEELKEIVAQNRVVGIITFGLLMCATTVIAPLTSLPLVPIIAPFLGPFTTGLTSFVGWFIGALLAFFIGRHYGRPVVEKLVPIDVMKKYERYLTPESSFVLIVVLRIFIPVDILSYALAMFTTVSFTTYASATAVGILWFSFAFAYLGDAFINHDYVLFVWLGVASVFIFTLAWYFAHKITRIKN